MNTPQVQVQYIFSHEGLRAAMLDILKEATLTSKQTVAEIRPPATRKQAAKFLNISLPTLDILLKTKQLQSFEIGVQKRISWDTLEQYINQKSA